MMNGRIQTDDNKLNSHISLARDLALAGRLLRLLNGIIKFLIFG